MTSGKLFSLKVTMWKIIVLCTILGLAAQKVTYDNYTVFRVIPNTEKQVEILRELEEIQNEYFLEMSFWKSPSFVYKPVDIMIASQNLPDFYNMMTQTSTPYEVYIQNVQKLIEETSPSSRLGKFDFNTYHTLDVIYEDLDSLARDYSDKVQTIVGGKTYEERQIKGIKISFKANNPGVFIEGGIHAREWISPATVMYIAYQLLTNNNKNVRELAERHDWYIFPLFNPDGYVYTHIKDRLWRKTRKPYGLCYGSDLNRNWDYRWNTGGSSSNPCSDLYAGSEPFSEIEAKSMSEYIKTISDKFYAYISFHNYGQFLIFPYGYTKQHLDNYDDEYAIGKKAIEALEQRYGTKYETGNIAEILAVITGDSGDYIKGIYQKPLVFTYELRDKGKYNFLLPPDQIIPTGEETMDSLVGMFKEAKARGYPKNI